MNFYHIVRADNPQVIRSNYVYFYSFTDHDVKHETIRLWKINTKITMGMVTITVAALISPQGTEYSLWYMEIPTGTVLHTSSLLMVKANKYSFHAAMNTRIAVVKIPGVASGKIIFRNV